MFGLEDQGKKKKKEEFIFDIEKEMKTPKKFQEFKQHLEDKIQKIKEKLRSGQNQSEFDFLGTILHGYLALFKVISRVTTQKK